MTRHSDTSRFSGMARRHSRRGKYGMGVETSMKNDTNLLLGLVWNALGGFKPMMTGSFRLDDLSDNVESIQYCELQQDGENPRKIFDVSLSRYFEDRSTGYVVKVIRRAIRTGQEKVAFGTGPYHDAVKQVESYNRALIAGEHSNEVHKYLLSIYNATAKALGLADLQDVRHNLALSYGFNVNTHDIYTNVLSNIVVRTTETESLVKFNTNREGNYIPVPNYIMQNIELIRYVLSDDFDDFRSTQEITHTDNDNSKG